MSLLNAGDLDDLSVVLDEKLANSFDIPIVRLLLSDQFNIPDNIALISPIKAQEFKEGGNLAHAISDKEPWVGRLTADRRKQLFGKESQAVKLCNTGVNPWTDIWLIALGHPDATHFQSSQDTLFLEHIGEALVMILPRLLIRMVKS